MKKNKIDPAKIQQAPPISSGLDAKRKLKLQPQARMGYHGKDDEKNLSPEE